MKIRHWFIQPKTKPEPSPEANEAMTIAETKLGEALTTLETAISVSTELQELHEANHFRERWLLALKGGE